jgi:hypothetical protein
MTIDFEGEITRARNKIDHNNFRIATEKLMPWQEDALRNEIHELEIHIKYLRLSHPKIINA